MSLVGTRTSGLYSSGFLKFIVARFSVVRLDVVRVSMAWIAMVVLLLTSCVSPSGPLDDSGDSTIGDTGSHNLADSPSSFANTWGRIPTEAWRTMTLNQLEGYLAQGFDPRSRNDQGSSPLLLAAGFTPDIRVHLLLLDLGNSPNQTTSQGVSVAMLAAGFNSKEVVEVLLSNGASPELVDTHNRNIVSFVAQWGKHPKVLELLLNLSPVPALELRDQNQKVPWDYILANEFLAETQVAREFRSRILYWPQMSRSSWESLTITQLLDILCEDNRADVRDDRNAGPLHYAARSSKNLEIFRALVGAGAEVNLQDQDGWTALMVAAEFNSFDSVTLTLLAMGADPDLINADGWNALMVAGRWATNGQIIRHLVQAGAKINTLNSAGFSALMIAAWRNPSVEVIQALLDGGADPWIPGPGGWLALDYARDFNPNDRIFEILSSLNQPRI